MKNSDILERMGLTKKESSIYLALLETGPATISVISKKTGIHRPLIYKTLPGLEDKRLIMKGPKGKLTQYIAEPPEKLNALFDELEDQFYDLLPKLKSTYLAVDKKPVVKFLNGKNGIKSVFSDVVTSLKRGDTFYRYSSIKNTELADEYLSTDYEKKRDNKQLERLLITSEDRASDKESRLERSVKIVPKESDPFDYDITQIVYANKVAFIDYNSETVTIIENEKFAVFQRQIFKLLYKKL